MNAAGMLEPQLLEPLLEPGAARAWLLRSGRAVDIAGTLQPLEHNDHLGEAGLRIALGSEPQYLTNVYADIKNDGHSLNVVHRMAQGILEDFQST
jgi:hypothetical protein